MDKPTRKMGNSCDELYDHETLVILYYVFSSSHSISNFMVFVTCLNLHMEWAKFSVLHILLNVMDTAYDYQEFQNEHQQKKDQDYYPYQNIMVPLQCV